MNQLMRYGQWIKGGTKRRNELMEPYTCINCIKINLRKTIVILNPDTVAIG